MNRVLSVVGLLAIAAALTVVPGAAVAATPTNVDVSQRLGQESEEAVAVNPTNPNNIVVFTNIGHREAGLAAGMFLAVSFDGGATWTSRIVGNNDNLADACCDPYGCAGGPAVFFKIKLCTDRRRGIVLSPYGRTISGGDHWNRSIA